jgi:probable F420-dependent oxidoreductase
MAQAAAGRVEGGVPRRLGKVGVWLGALGWAPAGATREAAAEIEALGYGALWFGEAHSGKEIFSNLGVVLAATRRMVVASGIANIWVRDATAMTAAANTLAEAYPERFVLGLGVSHPPQLAPRGLEYRRPVATMSAYLDAMDATGYEGPRSAEPVYRVLAALRPRMLELARDKSRGAHPYFVPPAHTIRARKILGPGRLLAPEQAVLLETDPVAARARAREHMAWYLTLPNYAENLRWLGFTDEDLGGGISDRLVDAIVAWGDEAAIQARVREHLDAGADHVSIQPLEPNRGLGLGQLRLLAPALLEV